MWHSTWKRPMNVSLKRKSLILFERHWNAPNADHCSVSTASKHSQPLWLRHRFPGRGFGVLIIGTGNKITLYCLPMLAASFYWHAKFILISIILTLCFHLRQPKHLQALRLSGDFHHVHAPSRGQRLQQMRQEPEFRSQNKTIRWKWLEGNKKDAHFLLCDLGGRVSSSRPAVSCWGGGRIVRLLKEAKPKFTCKQAVNATLATISVNLLLKTNNCCVWHILFSLAVESNFRPEFISIPHLHENSYVTRPFFPLICIKNAVELFCAGH